MKKLFLAMFCVMLAACGGGSSDVTVPKPDVLRTDLLYGYYTTDPNQYAETSSQVNFIWVGGMYGNGVSIANMKAAKSPTLVDLTEQLWAPYNRQFYPKPDGEALLRAFFNRLAAENVLQYVVALASIDEPDINVGNVNDISKVNAVIRRVAKEFPALNHVAVAVTYAGVSRLPFIEEFDWVGFDDYDAKSSIFLTGGAYPYLVSRLRPDQRTMLFPGGFRGQDPAPFINWAHTDKRVVAVVPFLWSDVPEFKGIRSLPIRSAYCTAGALIKTPGVTPRCT